MSIAQEISNLTSRVLETLAFIKVYAPDFPAEDETTIYKEFSKLFELLQSIAKLLTNTDGRRWVDLTLQETRDALRAFDEGHEDGALHLVHSAEDHFRSYVAGRRFKPGFQVTQEGNVEKL